MKARRSLAPAWRASVLAVLAVLAVGVPAGAGKPRGREVASIDPRVKAEAKAHYDKGHVYYNAQLYDEAFKEFQAAYLVYPAPDFLFNMGQALRLGGKLREALNAYERYLTEYPQGQDRGVVESFITQLKADIAAEEKKKPPEKPPEKQTLVVVTQPGITPRRPIGAYSLIGVGALVTVVGAGLMAGAAITQQEYETQYGRCFATSGGPCRSSLLVSLGQRGDAFNIVGPVLVGVGVATAGVGAYLWFRHRRAMREQRRQERKIVLVPELSSGGVGIVLGGELP